MKFRNKAAVLVFSASAKTIQASYSPPSHSGSNPSSPRQNLFLFEASDILQAQNSGKSANNFQQSFEANFSLNGNNGDTIIVPLHAKLKFRIDGELRDGCTYLVGESDDRDNEDEIDRLESDVYFSDLVLGHSDITRNQIQIRPRSSSSPYPGICTCRSRTSSNSYSEPKDATTTELTSKVPLTKQDSFDFEFVSKANELKLCAELMTRKDGVKLSLDKFPNRLICQIFSYLTVEEFCCLSKGSQLPMACKLFSRVVSRWRLDYVDLFDSIVADERVDDESNWGLELFESLVCFCDEVNVLRLYTELTFAYYQIYRSISDNFQIEYAIIDPKPLKQLVILLLELSLDYLTELRVLRIALVRMIASLKDVYYQELSIWSEELLDKDLSFQWPSDIRILLSQLFPLRNKEEAPSKNPDPNALKKSAKKGRQMEKRKQQEPNHNVIPFWHNVLDAIIRNQTIMVALFFILSLRLLYTFVSFWI